VTSIFFPFLPDKFSFSTLNYTSQLVWAKNNLGTPVLYIVTLQPFIYGYLTRKSNFYDVQCRKTLALFMAHLMY